MYFKFNDRSEVIIDTNSILYTLMIDEPKEFGIKIYFKKEVIIKEQVIFIDDYYSIEAIKEDYKRLLKALEVQDN